MKIDVVITESNRDIVEFRAPTISHGTQHFTVPLHAFCALLDFSTLPQDELDLISDETLDQGDEWLNYEINPRKSVATRTSTGAKKQNVQYLDSINNASSDSSDYNGSDDDQSHSEMGVKNKKPSSRIKKTQQQLQEQQHKQQLKKIQQLRKSNGDSRRLLDLENAKTYFSVVKQFDNVTHDIQHQLICKNNGGNSTSTIVRLPSNQIALDIFEGGLLPPNNDLINELAAPVEEFIPYNYEQINDDETISTFYKTDSFKSNPIYDDPTLHPPQTKYSSPALRTSGPVNVVIEHARPIKPQFLPSQNYQCWCDYFKTIYNVTLPPWPNDPNVLKQNPILLHFGLTSHKFFDSIVSHSDHPDPTVRKGTPARPVHLFSIMYSITLQWFRGFFPQDRSIALLENVIDEPLVTNFLHNMQLNQHHIHWSGEADLQYCTNFFAGLDLACLDWSFAASIILPILIAGVIDETRCRSAEQMDPKCAANPAYSKMDNKPITHGIQYYTLVEAFTSMLLTLRLAMGENDKAFSDQYVANDPTTWQKKGSFQMYQLLLRGNYHKAAKKGVIIADSAFTCQESLVKLAQIGWGSLGPVKTKSTNAPITALHQLPISFRNPSDVGVAISEIDLNTYNNNKTNFPINKSSLNIYWTITPFYSQLVLGSTILNNKNLFNYQSYRAASPHVKSWPATLYSSTAGAVDRFNRTLAERDFTAYTRTHNFVARIFMNLFAMQIVNVEFYYKKYIDPTGYDRNKFYKSLLEGFYWVAYNIDHFFVKYFPVQKGVGWYPKRGFRPIPKPSTNRVHCSTIHKLGSHVKKFNTVCVRCVTWVNGQPTFPPLCTECVHNHANLPITLTIESLSRPN